MARPDARAPTADPYPAASEWSERHTPHVCSSIAYPAYIREKARSLRTEQRLSLDEIAERLALGRTTVWYRIKDLPDPAVKYRNTVRRPRARARTAEANRRRAARARGLAYRSGLAELDDLDRLPGFRDFVHVHRRRPQAQSQRRLDLQLEPSRRRARRLMDPDVHREQDQLRVPVSRGSGPGGPAPVLLDLPRAPSVGDQGSAQDQQRPPRQATWRCRWGVMTVRVGDTALRARLQAWMDRVWQGWIDSIGHGV